MSVEVRAAGLDDTEAICRVWNEVWPTLAIDETELRRDFETLRPENRPHYWLGSMNERPVAFAEASHPPGIAEPCDWILNVGVLPEFRRRGLGSELYRIAEEILSSVGADTVRTQAREDDPDSVGFAESRGFQVTKKDFESTLDLSRIDRREMESWIVAPSDIALVSGRELDGCEFRYHFHEVFEEVRRDIPRETTPARLTLEEFDRHVGSCPTYLWNGMFVALDGNEIAGFTGVYQHPNDGWLYQWLTGVRRRWRGRGIAKALKARQILWAIDAGYRTIRTDNDSRNAGMLAVNDQLGFERLPALLSLKRQTRAVTGRSMGR
jgi:GNAT superfamily N-acetyltransferase